MEVAVSNRVVARNGIGQFIAACEAGAVKTVRQAVDKGANLSRELAPKGGKDDPRTPHLAESIIPYAAGTQGYWVATARHALPVEFGGAPHLQTGRVTFFWEREDRMWNPGDNLINHPGNPAQPYLRPAYKAVMAEIMQIAKRNYPN